MSIVHSKGSRGSPTPSAANGPAPVRRFRLTPAWAGRDISLEEFEKADCRDGWRYELIDGRLEVFANPELPHDMVLQWIHGRLLAYGDAHVDVINYVSSSCRVFIPGRRHTTCPQPDLAAYRDYPYRLPRELRRWQVFNPVLVVEVLSDDYRRKDLERNVALYRQAPSLNEYWILDPQDAGDHPTLRVYRKRGARTWQRPIDVPFDGTYTTPLLPGFTLIVNPTA
jgi:Uma2 family endonuclease